MAARRHAAKAAKHRITSAAIASWLYAKSILEAGDDKTWEKDGGRRREFLEASASLHRQLGLKPWERSPLEADDGPSAVYLRRSDQMADYEQAQDLRLALLD